MYAKMLLSIKGTIMNKNYGIFKIPIKLSNSLEGDRQKFEQVFIAAQVRLKSFTLENNWKNHIGESFADSVEIYDSKEEFDKIIREVCELKPTVKLDKTFSAALEKRRLITISPEIYAENYPDGIEENSFEKLLTHEMAHRFHIRLLDGDEDAMGPIWFFEGFAIHAAGQFSNSKLRLTENEIWEIVNSTVRGSYKKYGYIFRYFLEKIPLNKMIEQAREKNFNTWLQSENK